MASLPSAQLLFDNKIDTLERLICFCVYSLKKNINTSSNPQAQAIDYSTLINLSLNRFNQRSGKLNIDITFVMDKEKYYNDGNIIASLYEYTTYDIFYNNPATFDSVANANPLVLATIPFYVDTMERLLLWTLIQWNISLSISYYDEILEKVNSDPGGEQKIFIHNDESSYTENFDSNAGTFTIQAVLPFDWLLYMYTSNILNSMYQVALAPASRVINATSVVDALYDPLNRSQTIILPQSTLNLTAINNPAPYDDSPLYIKANSPDWHISWFEGFGN